MCVCVFFLKNIKHTRCSDNIKTSDPSDRDRPDRPGRLSRLRVCFHMIVAWSYFETTGTIGTIGTIIWKPGLRTLHVTSRRMGGIEGALFTDCMFGFAPEYHI